MSYSHDYQFLFGYKRFFWGKKLEGRLFLSRAESAVEDPMFSLRMIIRIGQDDTILWYLGIYMLVSRTNYMVIFTD